MNSKDDFIKVPHWENFRSIGSTCIGMVDLTVSFQSVIL